MKVLLITARRYDNYIKCGGRRARAEPPPTMKCGGRRARAHQLHQTCHPEEVRFKEQFNQHLVRTDEGPRGFGLLDRSSATSIPKGISSLKSINDWQWS